MEYMDIVGIIGLVVGMAALLQAYLYNRSANKTNEETRRIQKHIQKMVDYNNLVNISSFLNIRDLKQSSGIILKKDVVIFEKGASYLKSTAAICEKIIFDSNIVKMRVYGEQIFNFLNSDEETLKITLKFEISQKEIKSFLYMASELLKYDVCILYTME